MGEKSIKRQFSESKISELKQDAGSIKTGF